MNQIMIATMAMAPTASLAIPVLLCDVRMISSVRAAATTTIKIRTGRSSVFQCGCSCRTRCSPSVRESSLAIGHIVARIAALRLPDASPQMNNIAGAHRDQPRCGEYDQPARLIHVLCGPCQHLPAGHRDPDGPAQGPAHAAVLRPEAAGVRIARGWHPRPGGARPDRRAEPGDIPAPQPRRP